MNRQKTYLCLLLVALLSCFGFSASAQDVIILRNGNEIAAFVQEVGIDEIHYVKADNPNGPNYVILKAEVERIIFENGTEEVFSAHIYPFERYLGPNDLRYYNGVWKNSVKLKPRDVRQLFAPNVEMLSLYNRGRVLSIVGQVVLYPSAAIFGTGLGLMLIDGVDETSGSFLGVGSIGVALGMTLYFLGENRIKTSISIYNYEHRTKNLSSNLIFGITPSGGVGFTWHLK